MLVNSKTGRLLGLPCSGLASEFLMLNIQLSVGCSLWYVAPF